MAIEQSLMRLLKVQGGLTHGRGVSDSQLAYFVLSFPGCLKLTEALEKFTGVSKLTTEQHVELRDSRVIADIRDSTTFLDWLRERSPWVELECLRSLSSGIVADSKVNCHNAHSIGLKALIQITGSNFADVKLTRKNRVLSLATVNNSVKIRDEVVPVESQQLFVRIIWAISNQQRYLCDYLKYELSPRPPALFDDVSMRKTAKCVLLDIFNNSEPPDITTQNCPKVIDGGYLLRVLVWPRPSTFGEIIDAYHEYVVKHFTSDVFVVFDGHSLSLSTKSEEHKRRCAKRTSPDIKFGSQTTVSLAQADFLANSQNKSKLIHLLSRKFESKGLRVRQAGADADTLIVETALEESKGHKKVMVIAADTDVLLMLLTRAPRNKLSFVSPGSRLYDINTVQSSLGPKKDCLLFLHAITGCDTTSALYGKGKKKAWNLLNKPDAQKPARVFNSPGAQKKSVISAGENFIMKLYASSETHTSLDELRGRIYARTLAKQTVTVTFELANLSPTSAAAEQHNLRSYLQVQDWLGNSLPPTEWGWKIIGQSLFPIATNIPTAPEELLNLISCACKNGCFSRCSCRTAGLHCSLMCTYCKGRTCNNGPAVDDDDIVDEI